MKLCDIILLLTAVCNINSFICNLSGLLHHCNIWKNESTDSFWNRYIPPHFSLSSPSPFSFQVSVTACLGNYSSAMMVRFFSDSCSLLSACRTKYGMCLFVSPPPPPQWLVAHAPHTLKINFFPKELL